MRRSQKLASIPLLMFAMLLPGTPLPAQDDGQQKVLQSQLLPMQLRHEELSESLGPNHPNVVLLSKRIESMKSMIAKMKIVKNGNDNDEVRDTLKQLVAQVFELQIQIHAERIERAEDDLKKAKAALAERKKAASTLIDRQVESLIAGLEGKPLTGDSPVVAAKPKFSGETSTALSERGWAVWRQRRYDEAIPMFQASVKQDPQNARALNGLGWSYTHTQQYDKAIGAFEKALAIDPQHGGAMNGIAQVLMAQGKTNEAKERFLKAVDAIIEEYGEKRAVELKATAAWFGLVQVLIMRNELDEASNWVERFRKHDAKNPAMTRMAEEVALAKVRAKQ
ncbi:MAG: tetratricopeptide repeat protein [Planctomycetota bacterium]